MSLELKSIDKQKVGSFNFKKLNGQYLLTNDIGEYCFLVPQEFDSFLSGKIDQTCPDKYQELESKGFIRNRIDYESLSRKYASKKKFLSQGTSLHIIVVTLRCDHACIYCQAGVGFVKEKDLDMDIPTAQKVVDRIFESPSSHITIEFQGGEPLINFNTVKFIIEYAREKNIRGKKSLTITLVSNLSYLTEGILEFLIKNEVSICTSLDGPEYIHNKNRVILDSGKKSYKNTVEWLKRIKNEFNKTGGPKHRPGALLTVSRFSFAYPKEIVDEYLKIGLDGIYLRPMSTFVFSKKAIRALKYSWGDFIAFYKKALDYILEINLKGKEFHERTAVIFLTKILTDKDPDFLDIRSPCGAGIGQLAYNFNGSVYTCDEARMLSRLGDESFRIGNVRTNSYAEMRDSPTVKAMCIASCLDNLPGCSQCAYKPYCGVCPLLNYAEKKDIFIQRPSDEKCKMQMAILDYLFGKIKNKRYKEIFQRWIDSQFLPLTE